MNFTVTMLILNKNMRAFNLYVESSKTLGTVHKINPIY